MLRFFIKETQFLLNASREINIKRRIETGKYITFIFADQTVSGLTGQAQQAVDTLLHPGS